MSTTQALDAPPVASKALRLALIVIATAQLMLVLDDAIANIALPSIQQDLGVSAATLPWIVNTYVLSFGSLLLFGGRLGDLFGRRRVLQAGLAVFVVASLLGGLGVNEAMLIASRGLQGLGAALVAPNVLALIATTFPAGRPRNGAIAVYGAMSGLGMTLGVLLGGILTGLLNWRWVFFVNIPIGLAVLAGTKVLVEGQRNPGRLDIPDALSGTAAMFALAYGITRGGEHGWTDAFTIGAFVAAAVLASVFVALQAYREHPMLPLGLFRDRNRSGAYATVVFIGGGLMATYYLLTLFLQQVLSYGPLEAGLASLPVSAGIILSAAVSSKLVERFSPRAVAVPGLLIAAGGLYWLSTLTIDPSYFAHILPAVFITYFGLLMGFMPMTLTAVHGLADEQTGVASALLNTAQQIGAGLGVAVLSTVAMSAADGRMTQAAAVVRGGSSGVGEDAMATAARLLADGYATAFLAGAAILVVASAFVGVAVTAKRTHADAANGAAS